jgi:2-hydroxychromene-2-carboxylate isomerase
MPTDPHAAPPADRRPAGRQSAGSRTAGRDAAAGRAGALPSEIELFFDPVCPWTWATSRWLVEATARRGIEIVWRSLSLAVLNAGKEIPPERRAAMAASPRLHRIFAALREDGRSDLVGAVYTAWGRRSHHDGAEPSPQLIDDVVRAAGAGEWAAAGGDDSWDAAIEASTKEGVGLAGGDVGSPVVALHEPRRGLFGPIVSPPPTGEEADALLDLVVTGVRLGGFYSVQHARPSEPQFGPRP